MECGNDFANSRAVERREHVTFTLKILRACESTEWTKKRRGAAVEPAVIGTTA